MEFGGRYDIIRYIMDIMGSDGGEYTICAIYSLNCEVIFFIHF